MQKPYGKVDGSCTQGEEKSGEKRTVSTAQKTVSECVRYDMLKNCFQLPFPQMSYTESQDGETPTFPVHYNASFEFLNCYGLFDQAPSQGLRN